MGDAWSESKRINDDWDDAKMYCDLYFNNSHKLNNWTKEDIEKIVNQQFEMTMEELAKAINFKK